MMITKAGNLGQMRHADNLVALRHGLQNRVLFLEINGLNFTAREEDATQAVRLLAAGSLDEASFKNWLCDNIAAG